MLRTTLFFCLFFALSVCATAQKSVIIKGYITHTEDYCNGAAPTPEIEAALATEKPESGNSQTHANQIKTNQPKENQR